MKKIVITGANGMLGTTIANLYKNKYEVFGLTRDSVSIENYKEVKAIINDIRPDVIIHCAAYTNVEAAETNPDDCYNVNFLGTFNLVNASRMMNCKFIYISSTGCYGSLSDSPYREIDPVSPTTVYHKSKVSGENAVVGLCSNYLVLRTGWLFGGNISHKKNFVYNRYQEAIKSQSIISDPFQAGNPTFVDDVANQIEVLIDYDVCGIFNVVGEGYCTRYDYVSAIIHYCGLATIVQKADTPFKRLAAVSNNETAENYLLHNMGLNVMKPWKDSLKKYIQNSIIL
jgi:dTDP-4-dehydrorhamnose reductase